MEARMPKHTYPIVEVIWVDAEEKGEAGWNDVKEMLKYAKKPCPTMHSVGYEVFKSESHISLLSTIGPDECSTLEKIPMNFIKEIHYMDKLTEEPPPRTRRRKTTES